MKNRYSTTNISESCAKALGRDLPISTKQAISIADYLRGKDAHRAVRMLSNVIEMKEAVPMARYPDGLGHKKNMAAGRYPVKASSVIKKLLESAIKNAQDKSLNTESIVIRHICAHKGSSPAHMGRHPGREMKRTHFEIILEEQEKADKKKVADKKTVEKKATKEDKKSETKVESSKPEEKATEEKATEEKATSKKAQSKTAKTDAPKKATKKSSAKSGDSQSKQESTESSEEKSAEKSDTESAKSNESN